MIVLKLARVLWQACASPAARKKHVASLKAELKGKYLKLVAAVQERVCALENGDEFEPMKYDERRAAALAAAVEPAAIAAAASED